MHIGIDVHKRYSQIAVLDHNGEIQAAIEATSNNYHIYDTLSEYLDVTVANPSKLKLISDTVKKTDRVDAKQLAWMLRLGLIPESYVPIDDVREARARVRWRHSHRLGTERNTRTRSTDCCMITGSLKT